jgi:hypothetical protein
MHICKSELKQEEKQIIEHQSDNEVRQSHLRLWDFVSVGDAFLFMFKYLKVHHSSDKNVTNWSGLVLRDL